MRIMTKKSISRLLYILFVFLVSQVSADIYDEHEDAFYALSSLRFHLEEKLDPPVSDDLLITFDKADIANLWKRASASPFPEEIAQAESYYQEALLASPAKQHTLLSKAKTIIDSAWINLNPSSEQPLTKGFEDHRYILPADHWLHDALDSIFTEFDAHKDEDTFGEAGFVKICKRNSDMIVAKHEQIPGYIIKIYLRENIPMQTWEWVACRCQGAENIRNLIKRKGLKHFNVPDKWIYRIPELAGRKEIESLTESIESKGQMSWLVKQTSPACLVAALMNVVSDGKSRRAWKEKITRSHLRELYCILSHGFSSTCLDQNIPYTKEGKFTCLDTEIPFRYQKYYRVIPYLTPEMRTYWGVLVRTGGKP